MFEDRIPRGTSSSDFDQRPVEWGRQVHTMHACPACPSPLAAGLAIAPSIFCRYCHGTGLVDESTLYAWCRDSFNEPAGVTRQ